MPNPTTGLSRGQQLAAEAAEAAEVRDALTHPDVVALRVEKVRTAVDRFIWTGMVLGLLFTMTNVQQFTAHTTQADPGGLGWWAAWLLDPTVSVILLGVLIAEREVSRWRIPVGPWARAAKWSLLAATYVMNTWESYAAGNIAGIVLHSVPPLAVFMGAEAVTDCQDKLTEAVERAHAYATQRAERKAAQEAKHLAPEPAPEPVVAAPRPAEAVAVAAPAPAVGLRAVPAHRPDPAPTVRAQVGPQGRSADRTEDRPTTPARTVPAERSANRPARAARPARKRTGRHRTDAQLSAAVRELAEQNGGAPPSQYQVKQRFGVGSGRAARLLADLSTTPDQSGGTATRKDGDR